MRHGSAAQQLSSLAWHFGCNSLQRRHVVNAMERVGLAVAVPILVAAALFTHPRPGNSHPNGPAVVIATDIALASETRNSADDRDDADGANGFVDVYGNEVTDAVATYTFDQTGSLYELHSPQTELPRLGIPKS
jgi:hypothetical protein